MTNKKQAVGAWGEEALPPACQIEDMRSWDGTFVLRMEKSTLWLDWRM